MDKTIQILELQDHLRTELYITEFTKNFLKINRSVSLDKDRNIIALNLSHLQISDLKPLENLKHLQSLYLESNIITDINPLQALTNLKFLNLGENNINDVSPLSKLTNLETLHLFKNDISNISILNELKMLKILNISFNKISDISVIKNFRKIKTLSANSNSIVDILSLTNLKELERIFFDNNQINDISSLKKLNHLHEFIFTNNYIFDLSPIYGLIKNEEFTRNYNFFDNPLVYPPMEIYLRGDYSIIEWFKIIYEKANTRIKQCLKNKQVFLDLSFCGITDLTLIPNLFKCLHLEELILSNEWAEYIGSDWVKISSKNSGIRNNLYEIPIQISKLKKLKKLIIGGDWENDRNINSWRIKEIKAIGNLIELEELNVSNNKITTVNNLKKVVKLKHIYINNNKINSIINLGNFETLKSLNASNNNLSNISFLKNLKTIEMLDLHSNNLREISDLEDLLMSLKKIIIDNNPIVTEQNWKLSKYDNHLSTIENYLSKKRNAQNKNYILPIKVLLLGNHGAGKSTLLNYLIANKKNRKIDSITDSTHIIRIENYPKTTRNKLPEIIYFDFGGQDYYHGIYKAFLTNDSINILLWNVKTDKNQIRTDKTKDILTRDFTKEYWLNQLKYHYGNRFNNYNDINLKDDIILIAQTHADEDHRVIKKEWVKELNISNEFFIALNQKSIDSKKIHKINLDFLESNLAYEIEEKKKQDRFKVSQPIWYGKFLSFIFNYSSEEYIELKDILKNYNENLEVMKLLKIY
ncbi:leucine-rich repeat domain-containing protein [Flavobacterium sp.]|uniref:leucine-rich repeat domain-containing protein n=1 Tax=Flavobacterium sp. TaxID=239 RepID=UPI003D09E91C